MPREQIAVNGAVFLPVTLERTSPFTSRLSDRLKTELQSRTGDNNYRIDPVGLSIGTGSEITKTFNESWIFAGKLTESISNHLQSESGSGISQRLKFWTLMEAFARR